MGSDDYPKQSGTEERWPEDPEGSAGAGKTKGEKVKEERGEEFYEDIGRKREKATPKKGKTHGLTPGKVADADRM